MKTTEVEDVLNVSTILSANGAEDAAHQPYLIAALIDWADHRNHVHTDAGLDMPVAKVTQSKAKAKGRKATESKDSDFEPTPDPSADDDEPDF